MKLGSKFHIISRFAKFYIEIIFKRGKFYIGLFLFINFDEAAKNRSSSFFLLDDAVVVVLLGASSSDGEDNG